MEQNTSHPHNNPEKATQKPARTHQPVWPLLLTLAGFGVLFFLLIFSLDNTASNIASLRQQAKEVSSAQQTPAASQEPTTERVTNKEIEVTLPSLTLSGTYSGDLIDGLPNGTGHFAFESGASAYYDGEWKDGLFHGYGKLHAGDGLVYEGDYANGMRNGTVKLFDLYGNFLSVSEYKDDKLVYTDIAYCKTLLDAFKDNCRWTYTPDYSDNPMAYVGTKVILNGYVDKVDKDGNISYLEFYPDQLYGILFLVRVLDLEHQEVKLSEGDHAMLYAVITGYSPYKDKDGRDVMGTALSAYSYVSYRPGAEETQALKPNAEYLNGIWSPNPDAVSSSGWVYEFSGSKLVVYDYVDTFLYATFDGTYRFLEDGRLHHSYHWEQFDENTGNVVDSYKGRLNHTLQPITQDVMMIDSELYFRVDQ